MYQLTVMKMWVDFSQEKITEMVAVGIARMKASSSVVQSTIDMVVADSSNCFLTLWVVSRKEHPNLCVKGVIVNMTKKLEIFLKHLNISKSHISNLEILISRRNIFPILVYSLGPYKCLLLWDISTPQYNYWSR